MAYPSAWTEIQGTATYSGSGYIFSGGFRWRIESQDWASNSSVVTVQLWAARDGTNGLTNSNVRTSYVEHDGGNQQTIGTAFNFLAANTTQGTHYYCGVNTAQWTSGNQVSFSVTHNDNGTRSVPIHTYHLANLVNWMSVDTTSTVVLDTIPRASLMSSFNNFNIETTAGGINGNLYIYSASFYNRVKLFEGATERASWDLGQLATGSSAYSLALNSTQRDAILNSLPSSVSDTFTLQVLTYSDSGYATQVGSTQSLNATGTIPSTYKPSITTSNSGFTWVNTPAQLTGYIIQSKSVVTATLSGGTNATGASYANYKFRYESSSSTNTYTGANVTWLLGSMSSSGIKTIYYSIQDSRGRWSDEISETYTVQAYLIPQNLGFDVRRNATTNTSADYILKFSNSLYSIGNTWTYTLEYYTGSAWASVKTATAIVAGSIDSSYTHSLPYLAGSTYQVRATLLDLMASSVVITDTLSTASFPFVLAATNCAAGKLPTNGTTYDFEVGTKGLISDGVIASSVAIGTAPMSIVSTTKVANLNVEMVDGYHAANTTGSIPISNGTLNVNLNSDMIDSLHLANIRGELGPQVVIGASRTLTQADTGSLIICTAAISLTMPATNAIVSGSVYYIRAGIGSVTLVANGNTIETSNLVITQGETLTLVTDGGGIWRPLVESGIYEQGHNANGYYIKYKDGVMKCLHTIYVTASATVLWGGHWYIYGSNWVWTYPATFTAFPAALSGSMSGADLCVVTPEVPSTTSMAFRICRGDTMAPSDRNITVCAIGRWK